MNESSSSTFLYCFSSICFQKLYVYILDILNTNLPESKDKETETICKRKKAQKKRFYLQRARWPGRSATFKVLLMRSLVFLRRISTLTLLLLSILMYGLFFFFFLSKLTFDFIVSTKLSKCNPIVTASRLSLFH